MTSDAFDLFSDIEVDRAKPPLGGVHVEVIEANNSKAARKRWGIPTLLKKGWRTGLYVPRQSTDGIRDRADRTELETIVSREVDGKWLVGSHSLERATIVQILLDQGYEQISDTTYGIERTEVYQLGK